MPGMGGVIPKEETYNRYGDAATKIGIVGIGKRGACARLPFAEIPGGGSLIVERFVYAAGGKPNANGLTKTGAYVGENRKLDAIFAYNVFRISRRRMRPRQQYNYRALVRYWL